MDSSSSIMASSIPDSDFTLPTEFLAEEDRVLDCGSSVFNFPIDFPYEFAVDSSSDEDDFVVGLTRRLTHQLALDPKKGIKSGSPKSTLSGIGSWSMSSNGSTNGEVSPPATPPGNRNDIWEPVSAGAGSADVSRLNNRNTSLYADQRFVYGVSRLKNQDEVNQSCSVWGRQQLKVESNNIHLNQIQSRGMNTPGYENGGRYVRPLGLPQSAWPPLQVQQNKHRSASTANTSVFVAGSGAKRGCNGTGVFLPRRFDDSTHNNNKSDCSPVLLPNKVEDAYHHQNLNSALAYKHDASMATRNGVLAQQTVDSQPDSAVKYELCLPQEWIY